MYRYNEYYDRTDNSYIISTTLYAEFYDIPEYFIILVINQC